jgi:hypothetical protein
MMPSSVYTFQMTGSRLGDTIQRRGTSPVAPPPMIPVHSTWIA